MTTKDQFLATLDQTIAEHVLLDHPFYQAWNEGTLSKEALREYVKQYYAHVRNFPVYLSATHSRCDDIEVRQLLLENLNDEERGSDNHPELWLRFADGLGVDREDVRAAKLLPTTERSVETLKSLTTHDNYLAGVAALYAYESQVPEIARTKREGLEAFYGMEDERSVSYFAVHEEADVVHRRQEQEILAARATDEVSQGVVLDAADASARAMWTFLDGIYETCVKKTA